MLRHLLLALPPLLAPLLPGAQEPKAPPAERAELPWAELVARDATLGFSARSAAQARRELSAGGLVPAERAPALLALGLGGALRELALLESSALEGALEERCAAVLALGELGGGMRGRLLHLLDDPEPAVAGCALLAALRLDPVAMRGRVDRIAGDPEHPLADEARRVLLFSIDPASAPPSLAGRRLLELRYQAARRYGLVEGQPFELLLLRRLLADGHFLDSVVLLAAAELDAPIVADQLLATLLERGGEVSLRAAVRGIPGSLGELVRHGLWTPDGAEWETILTELSRERTPSGALILLRIAQERFPGRLAVTELLARLDAAEDLAALRAGQAQRPPSEQIEVAAVWGASSDPLAIEGLEELARSSDPAVRAAALVQGARLRLPGAVKGVREVFADPEHLERPHMLRVAFAAAHDPRLHGLLEELLGEADPGPARRELAAVLAEQGRPDAVRVLLEELAADPPAGPELARALRALARRPTLEVRDELVRRFPLEDDVEANVELCLGLVRARDASVLSVLRAALWSDPFERSLLAAALVRQVGGAHALRLELDRVPARANSRDLRRVGFAMGLMGGIEEAEWLAARRGGGSGDPAVQGAYLGALAARTL